MLTDSYVSTSEAAAMLGAHHFTVQRMLERGKIPGEKVANRWFISRSFIEEMARTYVPKRGRPRVKRKYTRRQVT